MPIVDVLNLPEVRPDASGWIISTAGVVIWRGRLLVLWPGFRTDLASIPRLARPIVDNDEPGLRLAAMLHDAAYRNLVCFAKRRPSRAEADRMLYDVAVHRGLPKWKAALVWAAVRLFGWRYWND